LSAKALKDRLDHKESKVHRECKESQGYQERKDCRGCRGLMVHKERKVLPVRMEQVSRFADHSVVIPYMQLMMSSRTSVQLTLRLRRTKVRTRPTLIRSGASWRKPEQQVRKVLRDSKVHKVSRETEVFRDCQDCPGQLVLKDRKACKD
jgi:hypothetical protein